MPVPSIGDAGRLANRIAIIQQEHHILEIIGRAKTGFPDGERLALSQKRASTALALLYGLVGMVGLLASLTLCIGVIYAQPYRDDELASFLRAGCADTEPCVLTIIPGETYAFDAISTLGRHAWSDLVSLSPALETTGFGYVSWTWSGQQPALINDQLMPTMWIEFEVVQQVRIPLTISYGRAWFQFADDYHDSLVQLSARGFRHILTSDRIELHTTLRCPFGRGTLWHAPTEIRFGISPPIAPEIFIMSWRPCR